MVVGNDEMDQLRSHKGEFSYAKYRRMKSSPEMLPGAQQSQLGGQSRLASQPAERSFSEHYEREREKIKLWEERARRAESGASDRSGASTAEVTPSSSPSGNLWGHASVLEHDGVKAVLSGASGIWDQLSGSVVSLMQAPLEAVSPQPETPETQPQPPKESSSKSKKEKSKSKSQRKSPPKLDIVAVTGIAHQSARRSQSMR